MPCLYFMIPTSLRKKSECFFSDALFTNSLNGRVLWRKRRVAQKSAEDEYCFVCLCVRERAHSLVHKVFVKEVHLWHSGYVNLHFLVSAFLSKIFNCPLFQARSERRASQHGWSALEENHYNLAVDAPPGENLLRTCTLHTLPHDPISYITLYIT